MKDIDDFAAMNAVWESRIVSGAAPARTTIEARLAAASLLVEVAVVASLS
nr:Rid family hydrolase [Paralcaligenes ureilyticus]